MTLERVIPVTQWLGIAEVGCSWQVSSHPMCRLLVQERQWTDNRHLEAGIWAPVGDFFSGLRDGFLAGAVKVLSYMTPILALVLIMNSTGASLLEMVTNQTVPTSTVGTSPCLAGMNMRVILVSCNQPNELGWSANDLILAHLVTTLAIGFRV